MRNWTANSFYFASFECVCLLCAHSPVVLLFPFVVITRNRKRYRLIASNVARYQMHFHCIDCTNAQQRNCLSNTIAWCQCTTRNGNSIRQVPKTSASWRGHSDNVCEKIKKKKKSFLLWRRRHYTCVFVSDVYESAYEKRMQTNFIYVSNILL